ncbi:MAG: Kelch repeat-containing protein [Gammaproteobacteria bacterium]
MTNNAVTTVTVGDRVFVISFAGLTAGKSHTDTLDATFVLDKRSGRWTRTKPVPGGAGRLAATATTVGQLAYVFGGYTVAKDGAETSTPWLHAFDPVAMVYEKLMSIPVPVDDAMALAYRDRYIYLISGWHDHGNVNLVQRYDTLTDRWIQATPVPGRAVFGHAGGIVGNRIVYCDGVAIRVHADRRRDFVANDECFIGHIDDADTRRIDWRRIDPHPGAPRYRMAAAGIAGRNAILFVGGTENPYNYDGIGYDGQPSAPAAGAFWYDLESGNWKQIRQDNTPTMDHRGLVPFGDSWLTVGGMLDEQQVMNRVIAYDLVIDDHRSIGTPEQ